MASYLYAAQQVMSALNGMGSAAGNATASAGNSTAAAGGLASVTDFSSLVTLLFSLGALRDWLKLIVFGGVLETLRRMAFSFYYKIIASFWITAHFDENDSSYDWMMVWLSKQPSWASAREVEISTRSFGLNTSAIMVPGEEDDNNLSLLASRKLAYLPSASLTYSMWYHRRYLSISRVQTQTGYYGQKEETLQISIFTRHHRVLNELLLEAKKDYMAAEEHSISIYVSDINNSWRHVASRPKRNINSIILDPGVSELLVDDARDFLESKAWYAARGIPFRRGYLLYGAPGSGKTSIISSIAGELGLDVYIVSLSRAGLDDSALSELISNLPEKCIALMEDIDAAFTQSLNRDAVQGPANAGGADDGKPPPPGAPPPPSTSRLSLSGLLNALDGVAAQEGRILYATTNKYTALDPALCRPGRMDIHIEFKLASKFQAQKLFYSFYLPSDEAAAAADDEKEDEKHADSGYNSSANTDVDADSTASEPDVSPVAPELEKPVFFGTSHRQHAPKLRRKQVADLAARFAEAIPERELSMAALQGFLMTYKIRPYEAVNAAKDWVESEREARLKKAQQTQAATAPATPSSTEPAPTSAEAPATTESKS
ncbi:P-loop containing nucleoside triphosphate hydrolase protein [Mycena alexandri]|uniref:P-loop containing nucleoside triphosphate hydrolase protein n=1 Tax=Mycena alexandri TaxID=1745969 RepID=A0AAD6TGC0_9AGAR|nr:P-loop containing nucleoside triphosphate hydrolase protein [Mycena alexandri]